MLTQVVLADKIERQVLHIIKALLLQPMLNGRRRRQGQQQSLQRRGHGGALKWAREHLQVLSLFEYIHKLQLNNRSCTCRELYYGLAHVFKTPSQVYRCVEKVCGMLKCSATDLRIYKSQRGFVAGCIEFTRSDEHLNLETRSTGMSIPLLTDGIDMTIGANHLVIVEKYTIYLQLCSFRIWEKFPMVLATGCGFPSHDTRNFVEALATQANLDICYFGDFDAHGILIFLTYVKFHSKPWSFRWLGIRYHDFDECEYGKLLDSTSRDACILKTIAKEALVSRLPQVSAQVSYLAEVGKKLELESIPAERIVDFITSRIISRNWISLESLQP